MSFDSRGGCFACTRIRWMLTLDDSNARESIRSLAAKISPITNTYRDFNRVASLEWNRRTRSFTLFLPAKYDSSCLTKGRDTVIVLTSYETLNRSCLKSRGKKRKKKSRYTYTVSFFELVIETNENNFKTITHEDNRPM